MKKLILSQIIFNTIFFFVFFRFTVQSMSETGLGFWTMLSAIFATIDFIRVIKLITVYREIKKHNKK